MARLGFVFNVERCNGCYSCYLACKDEFTGNDHLPTAAATVEDVNLIKVNEIEYGTGSKDKVDYTQSICQQCQNPPCMAKHPGQIYKRNDGVVIIDPAKAKGMKEIVASCPYGAIHDFRADRASCVACARCYEHCPRDVKLRGGGPPVEARLYRREAPGTGAA
jgi:Fe-S-cluster-containing dehydrogenase component